MFTTALYLSTVSSFSHLALFFFPSETFSDLPRLRLTTQDITHGYPGYKGYSHPPHGIHFCILDTDWGRYSKFLSKIVSTANDVCASSNVGALKRYWSKRWKSLKTGRATELQVAGFESMTSHPVIRKKRRKESSSCWSTMTLRDGRQTKSKLNGVTLILILR